MYRLGLVDAKGFLFCNLTVQDKDRLKQTLAKYKKIQGLTVKVEKL